MVIDVRDMVNVIMKVSSQEVKFKNLKVLTIKREAFSDPFFTQLLEDNTVGLDLYSHTDGILEPMVHEVRDGFRDYGVLRYTEPGVWGFFNTSYIRITALVEVSYFLGQQDLPSAGQTRRRLVEFSRTLTQAAEIVPSWGNVGFSVPAPAGGSAEEQGEVTRVPKKQEIPWGVMVAIVAFFAVCCCFFTLGAMAHWAKKMQEDEQKKDKIRKPRTNVPLTEDNFRTPTAQQRDSPNISSSADKPGMMGGSTVENSWAEQSLTI